jgi:YHS domain-containing protein
MKKTIAIILAISALSVGALAQGKPATKPVPKEIECAVMKGHKINIKDATKSGNYADHKGKRYFFCCAGCKPEFAKSPEKFAKAQSIPTPKK